MKNQGRTLEYGPIDRMDHQLSFMCVVVSVGEVGFFESPLATLSVKGKLHRCPLSNMKGKAKRAGIPSQFHTMQAPFAKKHLLSEVWGSSCLTCIVLWASHAEFVEGGGVKGEVVFYSLHIFGGDHILSSCVLSFPTH